MQFCNVTQYCDHALLQTNGSVTANADISGIGVLAAFTSTAGLTFLLVLFYYVFVFDPEKTGFDVNDDTSRSPAVVDKFIIDYLSKKFNRASARWEMGMEKILYLMNDQQIVVGVALLASAISQLKNGISAYHWQTTIYLVWFSSFTHVATLTILKARFRSNKKMLLWRIACMIGLVAMLVFALLPTGQDYWLTQNTNGYEWIPACCFYSMHVVIDRSDPKNKTAITIISILILTTSYTSRIIGLFKASSDLATSCRQMLRRRAYRILEFLYRSKSGEVRKRKPFYWTSLLAVIFVSAWVNLFESMLWEVVWLLLALAWGSARIYAVRTKSNINVVEEENIWGFGQCLAVAMLGLLLFALMELFFGTDSHWVEVPSGKVSDHVSSPLSSAHSIPTQNHPAGKIQPSIDSTSIGYESTQGSLYTTNSFQTLRATQYGYSELELNTFQFNDLPSTNIPSTSSPHHEPFHTHNWYRLLILYDFVQTLIGGVSLIKVASYDVDTERLGLYLGGPLFLGMTVSFAWIITCVLRLRYQRTDVVQSMRSRVWFGLWFTLILLSSVPFLVLIFLWVE